MNGLIISLCLVSSLTPYPSRNLPNSVANSKMEKMASWNKQECHQNESGYFYYDIEVYNFDFSYNTNGSLYSEMVLIFCNVNFTPGYIAYQNGNYSFNQNYGLKSGYIHVSVEEMENEDLMATSDSFTLKDGTPENTSFSRKITTTQGKNYSTSMTTGASVSLDNGVEIKQEVKTGITLSYNREVAISSSEPIISKQFASGNADEIQWYYEFSNCHLSSFTLRTITFMEMFPSGRGYEPWSFRMKLDCDMSNCKDDGKGMKDTKLTRYFMVGGLI